MVIKENGQWNLESDNNPETTHNVLKTMTKVAAEKKFSECSACNGLATMMAFMGAPLHNLQQFSHSEGECPLTCKKCAREGHTSCQNFQEHMREFVEQHQEGGE